MGKVALFPSSDFIAKNQLAREGSESLFPVTIPALTTIIEYTIRRRKDPVSGTGPEVLPGLNQKGLDPFSLFPLRKNIP